MGGGGGGSGGGVERVGTKSAKAQLQSKKSAIENSTLGNIPSVGTALAQGMGAYSLGKQISDLDQEGSYAVAVPGTSYAPQGQAYTEAPGMKSSAKLGSQGFKVGQTMDKKGTRTTLPTRPGMMPVTSIAESQFVNVPSGSIGQYTNTKPPEGSGKGYVGDVAGVVREREIFGQKVKTFTGKTGYSPTGQKMDTTDTGGKGGAPTPTPVPEAEEEAAPTSMAMLPGETPSQYRRRVRRYGGGTIVEGGGVLYK